MQPSTPEVAKPLKAESAILVELVGEWEPPDLRMENPADGCEIILRPIRLVEQGGAMLGEESVQKGLREANHFHLDPGGP